MTTIDEVEAGIYRIHTPLDAIPGGFSFNQYLVLDDEPLLFHTGGKSLFPAVRAAIERVVPVRSLRWIAISHSEADECGALPEMLEAAPHATALGSRVAATISVADWIPRPMRALAEGDTLTTGRRELVWIDAPHVPHGWDCGFLFDRTSRTLLCGDLFTQPGASTPALTEDDILGPSDAFRRALDYYSHAPHTRATLERIASHEPRTLACMHGSAWRGDGGALIRRLATSLATS